MGKTIFRLSEKDKMSEAKSFKQSLDSESAAFFDQMTKNTFREQAMAMLNAYWKEIGDQAEMIYQVFYKTMIYADMHAKNVSLVHLYEEGNDLELNMALYFYEKLCKFVEDNQEWKHEKYNKSQPQMLTAIKRRNELRDKVDVNISNRISLLEVLLHQFRSNANINPADFVMRSMSNEEHPKVREARLALEDVNEKIKAYETKKTKLEEESKQSGIKGRKAQHELAIFENGPESESLNESLLHAEALLRKMRKEFGAAGGSANSGKENGSAGLGGQQGTMFWMDYELAEKKRLYGRSKK